MIIKSSEIVTKIEEAVNNRTPFSLIRFGDGALKLLRGFLEDKPFLLQHNRQEGIPLDFFDELVKMWAEYANEADFIDCHQDYFDDNLVTRDRTSGGVWELMRNWESWYKRIGINTDRDFCSPEAGILFFVENAKKNLMNILSKSSICCITNFYEAEKILSPFVKNVSIKLIPGFHGNHYDVSYKTIMREIKEEANSYDLWLIGAGELGRLYTGEIKRCGGRAIDIGKVFDAWVTGKLDKRLRKMVSFSKHRLLFELGDSSTDNLD